MAVLSAVFAGLTSILAKCGIRKTDSDVATALRTIVVLLFSQLEKTHEMPPSSRDEGLFSCMARKTIPSHLSKLHRRLHSLYATQWAPRDTRRDSTGERSPFFPLKTRPDSPGESRMQP